MQHKILRCIYALKLVHLSRFVMILIGIIYAGYLMNPLLFIIIYAKIEIS